MSAATAILGGLAAPVGQRAAESLFPPLPVTTPSSGASRLQLAQQNEQTELQLRQAGTPPWVFALGIVGGFGIYGWWRSQG